MMMRWLVLLAFIVLQACGPASAGSFGNSFYGTGSGTGTGTGTGGGFPAFTPITSLTYAEMVKVDTYVTNSSEVNGCYTLTTDDTQNRTAPANADRWDLADSAEDPVATWAALADPDGWEMQLLVEIQTAHSNTTGNPYVSAWLGDTGGLGELGMSVTQPSGTTLDWDVFTGTNGVVNVSGSPVTADRFLVTWQLTEATDDAANWAWVRDGAAGAYRVKISQAQATAVWDLRAANLATDGQMGVAFQRLTADTGTGSVTVCLYYRLAQISDDSWGS